MNEIYNENKIQEIACNMCLKCIMNNDYIYHCPTLNNPFHLNGYDLCLTCAHLQHMQTSIIINHDIEEKAEIDIELQPQSKVQVQVQSLTTQEEEELINQYIPNNNDVSFLDDIHYAKEQIKNSFIGVANGIHEAFGKFSHLVNFNHHKHDEKITENCCQDELSLSSDINKPLESEHEHEPKLPSLSQEQECEKQQQQHFDYIDEFNMIHGMGFSSNQDQIKYLLNKYKGDVNQVVNHLLYG